MQARVTRRAMIGAATLALAIAAVVAGLVAPTRPVQAQPNPAMFAQQPPAACVCASPTPVFGTGGPVIAHCQCGALSCAAATAAGGVMLHCAR